MKKLLSKKFEISILHFIFLTTSKILIGIGLGLIIASHYWYIQPLWAMVLIVGCLILLPALYLLLKTEEEGEIQLKKKVKAKR